MAISCTPFLLLAVYSWDLLDPVWQDLEEALDLMSDLLERVFPRNVSEWRESPNPHRRFAFWVASVAIVTSGALWAAVKLVYDMAVMAVIALYCLARIYLVVECFINLTHLLASAYLLPKWSQYFPHIG